MSRILITGTTGYLGYILYQWFSEKSNYSIITLNERLENLIPQSLEVDWVIHCAAALRARIGEHHTSNVEGTQKLIEAFKNKPKIIYTSSKSVYGLIRNEIMTEKHTPIPDDE